MDEQEVCHVIARRLQAEHCHWDEMARGIVRFLRRGCKQAKLNRCRDELCTQLQTFRSELSQHFEEEAEGGCIEEAVCRCPRLSDEAQRIEQEHPRLLARLDEIIRIAWSRDRSDRLTRMFCQFNEDLTALEHAEQRVVQSGLNVNLDLES